MVVIFILKIKDVTRSGMNPSHVGGALKETPKKK